MSRVVEDPRPGRTTQNGGFWPPPIDATAPSTLNVTGVIDQVTGGTFTGTVSNLQFVNQNGNLAVTGLLTGTLKNAVGTVLGHGHQRARDAAGRRRSGRKLVPDSRPGARSAGSRSTCSGWSSTSTPFTSTSPLSAVSRATCSATSSAGSQGVLDGGGGGGLANLLNKLLGL